MFFTEFTLLFRHFYSLKRQFWLLEKIDSKNAVTEIYVQEILLKVFLYCLECICFVKVTVRSTVSFILVQILIFINNIENAIVNFTHSTFIIFL